MKKKVKGNRIRGIVKWFNEEKGIGFITSATSDHEFMVHYSSIRMNHFKTLTKGQQVLFEADDTYEISQAIEVQPLQSNI